MTALQMRAYHRWLGLVSSVIMIFIGLTGLGLQLDLWITGNPVPGSEQPPVMAPAPTPPAAAAVGTLAADALRHAQALRPGMAIGHVDVSFMPEGTIATIGDAAPFGNQLTMRTGDWSVVPSKRLTPGWHKWMQDIHAGFILGQTGRIISAAMGTMLVILGVTGLAIYLDLYRRRAKAGRKNLFWKR